MAIDKRLTEKVVLPDPNATDLMHVVDISDLTGGASGTSKQATIRDVVVAGAGSAANEIIINSVSDFAVQDATTITLEEGKTYIRGAAITTDKRFVVSRRVTITSASFLVDGIWEYTGTDTMFTGVDVEFFILFNFAFRCPDAIQVFSFQDASSLNTTGIIFEFCFGYASGPTSIVAKKWGTFRDIGSLSMHLCAVIGPTAGLGIQDGLTLGGTQVGSLFIDACGFFSDSSTFIALDLESTLITQSFKVDSFIIVGITSGSIGISGLSNSANIDSPVIGTVRDTEFLGSITPLSGITVSDVGYDFKNSPPLQDSSMEADAFLTSTETVTISTQSVFVPIGGVNWSFEVAERFSVSTAGLLTYLFERTNGAQIIMSATVSKVGGGSDLIQLGIAINGIVSTKTIVGTESANPTALTSIGIFSLVQNDTIQAFVTNDGSISDVIVDVCNVVVVV